MPTSTRSDQQLAAPVEALDERARHPAVDPVVDDQRVGRDDLDDSPTDERLDPAPRHLDFQHLRHPPECGGSSPAPHSRA
jgi:hypothetical protein